MKTDGICMVDPEVCVFMPAAGICMVELFYDASIKIIFEAPAGFELHARIVRRPLTQIEQERKDAGL